MTAPETQAYQTFIDGLLKQVRAKHTAPDQQALPDAISAPKLRPLLPTFGPHVQFARSLSVEQQVALARLLEDTERRIGHDICAWLDWETSCNGLSFQWNGASFSESPHASWHYDFTCRWEGDVWPENDTAEHPE